MKINPKFFQEAKPAQIPDTTPKELWKTKRSAERYLEHFREVTKKEEANMDKPLKDWTLGETQEYCDEHECGFCELFQGHDCLLNSSPNKWDLSEKPRFTEQEVEVAKAIKLLFPDVVKVCRFSGVVKAECENGSGECMIGAELLPSIQNHQSYTLDEIIGGAE